MSIIDIATKTKLREMGAADLARAGHLDILSSDYVPAGLLAGAMILARIWDDLPRAIATVTAR